MSKKETVVVCFLMNAVLMVILFVGAIKHPEEKIQKTEEAEACIESKEEQNKSSLDSIDRLLDEYVIKKEIEKSQIVLDESVQENNEALDTNLVPDSKVSVHSHVAHEKEVSHKPKKMKQVKVVSGDSLDKIARAHATTVSEIMRINNLTSSTLQIGQILYISKESRQTSSEPTKRYYIVKSGDSPWTIASKNKLKLHELLKLNNLNDVTAKKLKPGDRLRIQ